MNWVHKEEGSSDNKKNLLFIKKNRVYKIQEPYRFKMNGSFQNSLGSFIFMNFVHKEVVCLYERFGEN
jgi:hypothetical protein